MSITARLLASDRVSGVRLALDRSVRSYDADGRLRVKTAVLTRACTSIYMGSEIPGAYDLGLQPGRAYTLLRPAAELQKAAAKFGNLPLLNVHTPVSAADHRPELVVGATGSNAQFDGEALTCDLVVWAKDAIDDVEDGSARELSVGYAYVPVMRPGYFNGVRYDGIMTQIEPNHVILCEKARVDGALVGDAMPRSSLQSRLKQTARRNYAMDDDTLLSKVAEFCDGKMSPDDIQALLKMLMPDDVPGAMDHRVQALGALAAARHQRTRSAIRSSGPDPRFPDARRLVRS